MTGSTGKTSAKEATAKVTITKDTIGKTKEGARLTEITAMEMADLPPPPSDRNIVSSTVDLGPDGATFDKGAELLGIKLRKA